MDLTKEDLVILKLLIEKELEEVKKEGQNLVIANSPFLNKEVLDDSDLDFLKSEAKYQQYLEELLQRL
ncbi:hypothetical protein COY27_06715 [Candidatus Woesearchaeota archaeon CG_4_10_14_0_2_um_filter_33_13]|nr:MAG: hypothetical protein COY27_06715 [Candidatus Woesearchaeota archaeon CG_4_10_14_0_2_um_filter_33_13]